MEKLSPCRTKLSIFFFRIFPSFDPPGWNGQFLTKKTTSKHVQDVFEPFWNVFRQFENMKVFPVFCSFSRFGPTRVHWAFSFRESYLQTISKLVWMPLRTFLDTFKNSNFFDFFFSYTSFDLQVSWGKKKSKKLPQASLDTFGNVFRDFETLKSFRLFGFFWVSRVHWPELFPS